MIEVSVSEVLDVLRGYAARPGGESGARVSELASLSGHSPEKVRSELAKGIQDGSIVVVDRVIQNLSGHMTRVKAYLAVSKPKKNGRKKR